MAAYLGVDIKGYQSEWCYTYIYSNYQGKLPTLLRIAPKWEQIWTIINANKLSITVTYYIT